LLASNQEERTALVEAASLRRERDALRSQLATARADALREAAEAANEADSLELALHGPAKIVERILDLIDTPSAPSPEAVRVKPLVWELHINDKFHVELAFTILGRYKAQRTICQDYAILCDPSGKISRRKNIEAAKTAAQADYEARILAALEPSHSAPSPEAVARAALAEFPSDDDREWIDNRADQLFRESERRRGGVRPATTTPQDFRDYFVVSATAERLASIIAKAGEGE
jgi:hypothetical protein